MREIKEVTYTAREVVSLTCDKCKKTVIDDDEQELDFQEFISLSRCGGYASSFGDGFPWSLDLCNKCAFEMFGKYVFYIDGD
jgi:hypothetical protein